MIAFGISLSRLQLDILAHLMVAWPGRVTSSDMVTLLYGEDEPEWPDQVVRTLIHRLRQRIADRGLGISNKRLLGYRLEFGGMA